MDFILVIIWVAIGSLGTWGVLRISLDDLAMRRKNKECRDWLLTSGTVILAETKRLSHRTLEPRIRYNYVVNDQEFASEQIAFGYSAEYLGTLTINEFLAQYPKGQNLEVFYDPTDPSQAVLKKLKPKGCWSGFVAWFILLPAIAFLTFAGIWQGILSFQK